MKKKHFKVYFVRPSVGKKGDTLQGLIRSLSAENGQHLPTADIQNDKYQIRDLERVGKVWKGVFAKLRDDAPHIVGADNTESAIPLGKDDHVVEKCFFLYREESNVLVWQYQKSAGGLSRAADYLSATAGEAVTLPYIQDSDKLEDVLRKPIYEIEFDYARPPGERPPSGSPSWDQAQFDAMAHLDAAKAKFMVRAPRSGRLSADRAKEFLLGLVGRPGTGKVRIRLTGEENPVDLFLSPVRDKIEVELLGSYPDAAEVFSGLEKAHDRQRDRITVTP